MIVPAPVGPPTGAGHNLKRESANMGEKNPTGSTATGDLVQTEAGDYAITVGTDEDGYPLLLPLGKPIRHELPVTKAS